MAAYANLFLAWVTVILGVFCTVIWALRLIHKKWYPRQKNALYRMNRQLRHPHKWLGITMVITGGIHGILSTDPLIGWNLGTLCWTLCILAGITYLFRKRLHDPSWMVWHCIVTVLLVCVLAAHIIHTGIQIDDVLWKKGDDAVEDTDFESMIDDFNQEHMEDQTADAADNEETADTEETPSATAAASTWGDGIYIGEGTGYNPGLRAQVTIEDGMIMDIEVIEHNERGERFWGQPVGLIPQRITDAQSTDVDTVTGATMTSKGIIEAVEDALAKASE